MKSCLSSCQSRKSSSSQAKATHWKHAKSLSKQNAQSAVERQKGKRTQWILLLTAPGISDLKSSSSQAKATHWKHAKSLSKQNAQSAVERQKGKRTQWILLLTAPGI